MRPAATYFTSGWAGEYEEPLQLSNAATNYSIARFQAPAQLRISAHRQYSFSPVRSAAPSSALAASWDMPSSAIQLRRLPAFLSSSECATLIRLAKQCGFSRSVVGYEDEDGHFSLNRTSFSCDLEPGDHPLVDQLQLRIAAQAGVPTSHVELDLLRYQPG